MILIGTAEGLVTPDGETLLDDDVTHVAIDESTIWVLARERILRGTPAGLDEVASLDGIEATCILPSRHGVFVGAADARLFRLQGRRLERVDSFDGAEGRDTWYTPWGGPPDVRSMSEASDGILYVGVHVGGILRSRDGGRTWTQTIDIDADIHQVVTHQDLVIATGWDGLHISDDAGETWTEHRAGFDNTYMRAAAVAGHMLLVSAAHSHAGKDAGVYRRFVRGGGRFERVGPDHPSEHNIDTFWLAADGDRAAFVTAEGTVYHSDDGGDTWASIASEVREPRCIVFVRA